MKLRRIVLFMEEREFGDKFKSDFNYHSKFISNYLTREVRNLKFETDGTFNMICVSLLCGSMKKCQIVPENSLTCWIPSFNRSLYESMCEINKYEYYLSLLNEGYQVCAQFRDIPIDSLLKFHQQFREGGYKNEWTHKRKVFKELGIDVILKCYFRSTEFQLQMVIVDRITKNEIISGIVLTTEPDEIHFHYKFKDIIYDSSSDSIAITDFLNKPKFVFYLSDILHGKFKFEEIKTKMKINPPANFKYDVEKFGVHLASRLSSLNNEIHRQMEDSE